MAEPRDGAEAIRRLMAEVDAMPRQELPGFMEWAYNHPGILTSRTKEPRQYDQDVRRAVFLERLRRDHPDAAHNAGLFHAADKAGLESLRSPYQPYSTAPWTLGPDHPISNAGRWMRSLPAAVYATGQMVANEFNPKAPPYPQAYSDYAKNMNNLLVFGEPFGANRNHMRDMADMRQREAAMPWRQIVPESALEEARAIDGLLAEPKTGQQFLSEAGVDGVGGAILGGLMDAAIDPLYSPAKTVKGIAFDFGPSTLPQLIEGAYRAIDSVRPAY